VIGVISERHLKSQDASSSPSLVPIYFTDITHRIGADISLEGGNGTHNFICDPLFWRLHQSADRWDKVTSEFGYWQDPIGAGSL
jgi:hypothetical protein